MRWWTAVPGLLLSAALLSGCAAEPRPRPESQPRPVPDQSRLDAVTARGELRVCSTGDYRPFTYRAPDGAWSGIDVDMARDLAAQLGVRATFVPTTWSALSADFRARCDVAAGGVSVTLERARDAFFSIPYVVDGKTPITLCRNANRFQEVAGIDRPGVRVAVNPGGTNEQFVRENLRQVEQVPNPDNNRIFDDVRSGRADLMITDGTEAKWQAKQHPELCAIHPERPFTFAEKAYLLPRGDVIFQQFVDRWLHLRTNDGTYRRIAAPWIG